jgi:hypothetical protein
MFFNRDFSSLVQVHHPDRAAADGEREADAGGAARQQTRRLVPRLEGQGGRLPPHRHGRG